MTGPSEEIERVGNLPDHALLYDAKHNAVIVFRDEWRQQRTVERPGTLTFYESAP